MGDAQSGAHTARPEQGWQLQSMLRAIRQALAFQPTSMVTSMLLYSIRAEGAGGTSGCRAASCSPACTCIHCHGQGQRRCDACMPAAHKQLHLQRIPYAQLGRKGECLRQPQGSPKAVRTVTPAPCSACCSCASPPLLTSDSCTRIFSTALHAAG